VVLDHPVEPDLSACVIFGWSALLLMDTFLALPFGHLLAGLYEGWKAPSFIAASSGDRMGPGPRLGGLLVAAVAPRRPS